MNIKLCLTAYKIFHTTIPFIFSEIDCDNPSMVLPTGGTFSALTETTFLKNGAFLFSCEEGFTPLGASEDGDYSVKCKSNGRWSLGTLTCLGMIVQSCYSPGGHVN